MSVKRRNAVYAIIGSVIAVIMGSLAFLYKADSVSELLVFVSAIFAGFSLILVTITLNTSKTKDVKKKNIYVSTSYSIGKDTLKKIKSIYDRYPIYYSDEIFHPGESIKEAAISDNIKNVSYCFMIVSGDLSPRQKNEIRLLKQTGATITPVIEGDKTKVPIVLQDYQPISIETFLDMGAKEHSK